MTWHWTESTCFGKKGLNSPFWVCFSPARSDLLPSQRPLAGNFLRTTHAEKPWCNKIFSWERFHPHAELLVLGKKCRSYCIWAQILVRIASAFVIHAMFPITGPKQPPSPLFLSTDGASANGSWAELVAAECPSVSSCVGFRLFPLPAWQVGLEFH